MAGYAQLAGRAKGEGDAADYSVQCGRSSQGSAEPQV